jgi:hypothetical protein
MSEWISHVRAYAKANGVSYKDAMQLAKASYRPSGGSLKTIARKAKNTLNKSEKVAQRVNKRADVIGRKAKNTIHTVARKGRNTALKVAEYADEAAPLAAAVAGPEAGAALFAASHGIHEAVGGSFRTTGAGVKKPKRQLGKKPVSGGCVGGKKHCSQCGGALSKKKAGEMLPPRSLTRLQKTN